MIPLIFLVGEGPEVKKLLFDDEVGWSTFLWGTLITVSEPSTYDQLTTTHED